MGQRTRLKDLLAYDLKTVRAYGIKEAFDVFWKYNSPRHAREYLRNWCARTMRSRIEPLKKFVKTLRRHEDLLLSLKITGTDADESAGGACFTMNSSDFGSRSIQAS